MHLIIDCAGNVTGIYGEEIDLSALGSISIKRASLVKPDGTGKWWADLAPVNGPLQGPFDRRSQALAAEVTWLEEHLFAMGSDHEGSESPITQ